MLEFKVPDMACSACVETITKAVCQIDASAKVQTDLDRKTVSIESQQPEETVKAAIVDAGYTVE
ncbi:MAG: heavy-metal-associated domain-containing protein [Cyanobacteria bacterium SID2]|nr:heavy-metal-associated domain-containing protein [Cyanobacteria bacterium SID2]MBP0003505.1 heavy-metal-associated domain-containing protein [Cyanobacteria bacterium SBC]